MTSLDINPLIVALAAVVVAAQPIVVGLLAGRLEAMKIENAKHAAQLADNLAEVKSMAAGIRGAVRSQRGPGLPPDVPVDRRNRT